MISPERLEILQIHWLRLVAGFGVEPAVALPTFDDLVALHSEPHRHYHTLEHVGETLKVAGRLAKFADRPDLVMLALWFHDAVYDPTRADNEERSIDVASNALREMNLDSESIEVVGTLVQFTKHDGMSDSKDSAVMLDADLAILAAGEARYLRYAADIRREYRHVSEPDYRRGRAAVLANFLALPRIFRTETMYLEAEAAARKNLAEEIALLA